MTDQTQKPTAPPPAVTTNFDAFKNNKLANDITNIHKALVLDVEIKKIPESTFINEILPVLSGEVVSAEFPLLMAAVAGNPFSELDIVDDAGKILFRMPALLERNIISHEEASKRGSLANVLVTAEMLMNQSPVRAQNYLEHEFNGRGVAKNRDEIINNRQVRWNEILTRYGKTLLNDGSVKDSSQVTSENKVKPQLDFENGDLL